MARVTNYLNGINVEAGYFYSYIGRESLLLGETWNYMPNSSEKG